MARYCTMHGFSRTSPVPCCTWWLGGTGSHVAANVALCGIHFCFLLCFLLVLEALEDGRVPKAASRLVHVWSPEARVTKDDRHVTAVQCQCCQCSESECVGLLSIRIIKYHQASYPEFFLFSFLDLLVWCSAISACLFFKKVFWICIIFGSQAPLWAWAGLVLAWLWPQESHTGTFWYFLVLLKLYDVTWNYYGSHKSYHDVSCGFRWRLCHDVSLAMTKTYKIKRLKRHQETQMSIFFDMSIPTGSGPICRSHDFSPGPRHQESIRNPSGIEQSSTIPWILPMLELWVLRWNHYRTSQVMISRICISFIFILCIYVAKMYLVLSGCFVKNRNATREYFLGASFTQTLRGCRV